MLRESVIKYILKRVKTKQNSILNVFVSIQTTNTATTTIHVNMAARATMTASATTHARAHPGTLGQVVSRRGVSVGSASTTGNVR